MSATIEMIKQLRQETGAGVLDCRNALEENNYHFDAALAYLLEHAIQVVKGSANRETQQGLIEVYSHGDGRIGVMVEINTETEFAARSETVRSLARELALQITAAAPGYVRDEDIPPHILEEQAHEAAETARRAGKPERIIEKIVEGVLEKFKSQNVLLRQTYIRNENILVNQLLNRTISQVGENIVIRRLVRWEIGPDK